MMKRNIALILSLWTVLFYPFMQIEAQEDKNRSITDPATPLESSGIIIQHTFIKPDSSLSLPLPYLDAYYRYNPVLNSSPGFPESDPFYLNYNMSKSYQLWNQQYIIPYNTKVTNVGLGNYKNVGAMLKWAPASNFAVEGGAFISLQYGYFLSSRHKSIGYNGRFHFDINHKIQLNIYGQYMVNNNKDMFIDYSSLFPKTHIGTSLEYKPQDNSKIGIGVEYQYDQQNQKWKPETKGKVSIGF